MTNNTITRIDALTAAIALFDVDAPERPVLENMLHQLEKRKNAPRSKTPARIQNERDARHLADIVQLGDSIGTEFVMAHVNAFTPQKVVGIMKVAQELGLFEKIREGKKVFYVRL